LKHVGSNPHTIESKARIMLMTTSSPKRSTGIGGESEGDGGDKFPAPCVLYKQTFHKLLREDYAGRHMRSWPFPAR